MNMTTPNNPQQGIKFLQDENELLLLQLHQVQEELEHYFLLNQTNERRVGELTVRLETTARPKHHSNSFYRLTDLLGITKQLDTIAGSRFFDRAWYLGQYPDVSKDGMDPARHYLLYGASEGRDPGPHFDTKWYLETYPDVAKEGKNPLLHYERYGKSEGREPRKGGVQITDPFADERRWMQLARDEVVKLAESRQQQIEQLTRERDEQAHWHQENAKWAKVLVGEKEELESRLARMQEELSSQQQMHAVLEQEKSALAGRREELERAVETLMQERDEQAHWHQENAKWAKVLVGEKEELESRLARMQGELRVQQQMQGALEQEKAGLAERLEAAQQRLEEQDVSVSENVYRQQLMNEELVRAEAQIDLIKELLLREPGL